MRFLAVLFIALFLVLAGVDDGFAFPSAGSHLTDLSKSLVEPATDLGAAGNRAAAATYEKYLASGQACVAAGSGRRVILTGFGPFQTNGINASGWLMQILASRARWPVSSEAIADNEQAVPVLESPVGGAKLMNRTVRIGESDFEVCLLVLDTRWDISSAILVTEMQRFQPELVIMSGLGAFSHQVTLEGAARNPILTMDSGYFANGAKDRLNTPMDDENLPERTAPPRRRMTWKNSDLAAKLRAPLRAMGLTVLAPGRPRKWMDYICNHLAFVAAQAARNKPVILAGGKIRLHPKLLVRPQVGFMHLPGSANDPAQLKADASAWALVYATLVRSALESSPERLESQSR